MVAADILPIVVFSSDKMVEKVSKKIVLLTAVFLGLQLVGQIPILIAVIRESIQAH